jgi:hypothetical protein
MLYNHTALTTSEDCNDYSPTPSATDISAKTHVKQYAGWCQPRKLQRPRVLKHQPCYFCRLLLAAANLRLLVVGEAPAYTATPTVQSRCFC